MRTLRSTILLSLLALAAGCGSSSGTDAGLTDAGSSHDAGTDGGVVYNGCTTFADHTGEATATVQFGGSFGLTYSPACLLIAAGNSVTFSGDFGTHPLAPGTTSSATAGSPNNPITVNSSGSTWTLAFPTAGDYPYHCQIHGSVGMAGVVRVR